MLLMTCVRKIQFEIGSYSRARLASLAYVFPHTGTRAFVCVCVRVMCLYAYQLYRFDWRHGHCWLCRCRKCHATARKFPINAVLMCRTKCERVSFSPLALALASTPSLIFPLDGGSGEMAGPLRATCALKMLVSLFTCAAHASTFTREPSCRQSAM